MQRRRPALLRGSQVGNRKEPAALSWQSRSSFQRASHSLRITQPKAKNMKMLVLPALATALIVASAAGFAQTSPPRSGSDAEFVTVQPAGQWSAGQFIGSPVTNEAGENIGDVNDVLFDKTGRVSTAVIGVGGFLGIGEKSVAVPFSALTLTADSAGKRVVTVPLSKERLQAAPAFQPTE